jgi:hypothetical protein
MLVWTSLKNFRALFQFSISIPEGQLLLQLREIESLYVEISAKMRAETSANGYKRRG